MAATGAASNFTLSVVLTSMLAGCGSASTTVLSPTPLAGRCAIALGVSGSSFAASGGTGTLAVKAERECVWSITERPPWVTISAVPSTQGAVEVSFAVEANRSTSSRSGDLVIADQRARITQEAATCPWTITPSHLSLDASGGDARARLVTEDFCAWEVATPARWITVSPERGKGSADLTLEVRANAGDKRNGKLQVGGAVVEIQQRQAPPAAPPVPPTSPTPPQSPAPPTPPEPPAPAPPPPAQPPPPPANPPAACSYAVSPLRFELSRKSHRVEMSVVTQATCELSATTTASWLDVSPSTQTGNGKLRLEVDENQSPTSRTGEVVLTGHDFSITAVLSQKGNSEKEDEDDEEKED